ncbi:MAG: hypothetical protein IT392_12680 [Nitrospirae bacterium]|nr:hypothetical protein [Nitrospirota bacterium]
MDRNILIIILVAAVVSISAGCTKQGRENPDKDTHSTSRDSSQPEVYMEYKNNPDWRGGEMGAIVPTVYFTGQVREAYAAAAEIPEVLDQLYCYCYCAEDHDHKSLRTCFTDGHGSGCDICMLEAIRAKELNNKGYSIKDIRAAIDNEFYEPYEPHGQH